AAADCSQTPANPVADTVATVPAKQSPGAGTGSQDALVLAPPPAGCHSGPMHATTPSLASSMPARAPVFEESSLAATSSRTDPALAPPANIVLTISDNPGNSGAPIIFDAARSSTESYEAPLQSRGTPLDDDQPDFDGVSERRIVESPSAIR